MAGNKATIAIAGIRPGDGRPQAMDASRRFRAALAAFAGSRDGGALLVGGVLLVAFLMIPVGAAMTNYAWREAQWEELRSAGRAAVAAAGPLLEGAERGVVAPIQERVAAFANASVPGFRVEAEDVAVSYDADRDATGVSITGTYDFDEIWMPWTEDAETVTVVVTARFEQERYEVAAALDISGSMAARFTVDADSGTTMVKMDGLKLAMDAAVDALSSAARSGPGSMMVSVVPFTSLVNAADTCNADPDTGLCQAARSAGKERYVRMLAGTADTMAATLANARTERDAGEGGHWVDGFHQYGAGTGLGPLRRQFLPDDLLDDRDWDLRRTNVAIDVSTQNPGLGTWTVDDEDFWNGCLMARWGAYWNPDARPAGWNQTAAGNWPARQAVAAWTPMSTALPATTPLHLSDAPPDAANPNTRFTAYSWPDARINGNADHLLQGAMQEMLNPNARLAWIPSSGAAGPFTELTTEADLDWSLAKNSGAILCPPTAVTPLTESAETLRAAVAALAVPESYTYLELGFTKPINATSLHLGVVWGLRTLSPLWREVWDITDSRGSERPVATCAPNEVSADCQHGLIKSILLITDGTVTDGSIARSRTLAENPDDNPDWRIHPCIPDYNTAMAKYHTASNETSPAAFNARFGSAVDVDGRLTATGVEDFADAYLRMAGDAGNHPRRQTLINVVANAIGTGIAPTPWQLFRGRDAGLIDVLVQTGSGFNMSGRPVLIDHRCRRNSMFGPYGRVDDFVYVGDTGPDASTPPTPARHPPLGIYPRNERMVYQITNKLKTWFIESCRLAGERRVRVNAIFIGDRSQGSDILLLERCVDQAGGVFGRQDVYVTPTADALVDALGEIFTHRRNLRFLDN